MKFFGKQRLAGLLLAAAVVGAPLAAPAFAQEARRPPPPPRQRLKPRLPPLRRQRSRRARRCGEAAPAAIAPPSQTIDKGDTTWMLVSTILVLLMIMPGLALFYGGLVRQKNMLSMLMQVDHRLRHRHDGLGALGLQPGLHRRRQATTSSSAGSAACS